MKKLILWLALFLSPGLACAQSYLPGVPSSNGYGSAGQCLTSNGAFPTLPSFQNCAGGGGGSPGGTSGQLQYNNANAFGGITNPGTANEFLVSAASTATAPSFATGAALGLAYLANANTWSLAQTFTSGITIGNITGSTQCLQVNTSGVVSGTGSACGSGGSTAFSALTSGTNTSAAMVVGAGGSLNFTSSGTINASTLLGNTWASPGAIGGTTAAAGSFTTLNLSGNLTSNITGSTQCVQASSAGVLSGTGSACGSGGSTAFSALTTGTNTTATMTVGAGGTLTYTSTGVVNANEIIGLTFPTLVSSDCLTNNGSTLSWGSCSGSAAAFSAITTGTNTSATMTVGSGGSLTFTGSGVVNSNEANGGTYPVSACVQATNSSSQPATTAAGAGLGCTSNVLAVISSNRTVTGTTDTIVCPSGSTANDGAGTVYYTSSSSTAVTLPQAIGNCAYGFGVTVQNNGTGTVTITPTTSTINGASTLTLAAGRGAYIETDKTSGNYDVANSTALVSGGGGVTSFTGDGNLLSNSASTGAVTATLANAAADSLWGNTSGSSGAPGYHAVNSVALADLINTTAVTLSGCTPSASTLGPHGGTFTQPATPCTTVTLTFAVTAGHGWNCVMGDVTQTNAGTYIPPVVQASNSTTTCVIPIPSAMRTTGDVLNPQGALY
jgi:hypothetical protein